MSQDHCVFGAKDGKLVLISVGTGLLWGFARQVWNDVLDEARHMGVDVFTVFVVPMAAVEQVPYLETIYRDTVTEWHQL